MNPRQLVWFVCGGALVVMGCCLYIGWQLCLFYHRTPVTMTARVRDVAKEIRNEADAIDRFGDISTPEITDTMRVTAHWLEHAIGDLPDSDGSKERIHKPYQRLLPSRVP